MQCIVFSLSNVGIYWAKKKLHDYVDFTKNKTSFRMELILALKTHTWSYRSQFLKYARPLTCDLWSVSLDFFGHENGAIITVNGDTYCNMITCFSIPALHDIDVNDVWLHYYSNPSIYVASINVV